MQATYGSYSMYMIIGERARLFRCTECKFAIYVYIFIPRQLGNGRSLEMIYLCSVGLMNLLRINVCQHVHVVKAVGSKFVSFITFNK